MLYRSAPRGDRGIADCGSTSSDRFVQKSHVSQPKSNAYRLPGAVGPAVSLPGAVLAVTAALGADAFPEGSTATTVNEYVVAAASRSTVAARSPVHSTLASTPSTKTRYVQQV